MSHVFISYVHENIEQAQKLRDDLARYGVKVWFSQNSIDPGTRWKQVIRQAIRQGNFFVACFSEEYNKRDKTYMNEELTFAIEELRQRPTDKAWFIPVKLNECEIPDRDIGAGETLRDIEWVELYEDWNGGIRRILKSIGKPEVPTSRISDHAMLQQMIDTSQKRAEIALSHAIEFISSLSPRISLVRPEKIVQRFLRDYEFGFDGQFTVINSERYIVFHKIANAIGFHYSQLLPEFDRIFEELVIGRFSGILKWIDFLSSDYLLIDEEIDGKSPPGFLSIENINWIRFNIAPFTHLESRDWYLLAEAHNEIHGLKPNEIQSFIENFQNQGWLVVKTPYYLAKWARG